MGLLYHIVSGTNVLLSNLPNEMVIKAISAEERYVYDNISIRSEKIKYKNGWIFLYVDNPSITHKIFNRYMECMYSFYDSLIGKSEDLAEYYDGKIRRLKHNINNYNAKIQDELENIISYDVNLHRNNWRSSIAQLENVIKDDLTLSAKTLLHIFKYVKLINAEMDVYDIMNSEKPILNISEHPIRKVVDLSVQAFFLDLIDKNVNISINDNNDKVWIDYPTISVVLGHIIDNAVKYILRDSQLNISISPSANYVIVEFLMTSLFVDEKECEDIFAENYSGYWATETNLCGHGIGMFYARKLEEMNNGNIKFIPGKEKYRFNGVPYADNRIVIELRRVMPK